MVVGHPEKMGLCSLGIPVVKKAKLMDGGNGVMNVNFSPSIFISGCKSIRMAYPKNLLGKPRPANLLGKPRPENLLGKPRPRKKLLGKPPQKKKTARQALPRKATPSPHRDSSAGAAPPN